MFCQVIGSPALCVQKVVTVGQYLERKRERESVLDKEVSGVLASTALIVV